MPSDPLPEPWRSFLRDLDTQLAGPTELHCFGGFVVSQCYGLTRPTADIDVLESKGTDLITLPMLTDGEPSTPFINTDQVEPERPQLGIIAG